MKVSRFTSMYFYWVVLGIALVTIPLSLSDTFAAMFHIWITIDNFMHCLLIVPASMYLIWIRRDRLAPLQPAVSMSGIVLVIGTGFLWVLGSLANATIIQDLAAVAFIPLSVWTILGRRITREIAFPLFYLFFMIPFGEFLIPRLMNFTADFTVAAVRLSGVPIYRDGLFMTIPNGSFKVIEACSGVRMMIASVAVGVLFANVAFRTWRKQLLFLMATVLLAMVANGLRAYTIVMIGHLIGMEAAGQHIVLGYFFFGALIIILLTIGSRFSDKTADDPAPVAEDVPTTPTSNLRGLLAAICVIAAVISTPLAASVLHASISAQATDEAPPLPVATGSWKGPGNALIDWEPEYTGRYTEKFGQYVRESSAVDVYSITYGLQSPGSELISSVNSIFARNEWIQVRQSPVVAELATGHAWYFIETELMADGNKRLIRHWYTVDGKPSRDEFSVKLTELKNAVQGRSSSSAVIAISSEFFDDVEAASATLDEFYLAVFADTYIQSD